MKHIVNQIIIGITLFALMLSATGITPAKAAPTVLTQTVAVAQTPSLLQFTSGGHILGFSSAGILAATGSHVLRTDFVNANLVQPQSDLPAQGGSATGTVMPLSRVTYANLWQGISLRYSAGGIYTSTYTLAPGADVKAIQLRYNVPVTLNKNGTLSSTFGNSALIESAPIAWQTIQGQHIPVDVVFQVRNQLVGFALGAYNPQYALTIDPVASWSTFLGGSGGDVGEAIAVDSSGNVYVAGLGSATWGSPVRAFSSNMDAFVAKLSPAGVLTWNTFLGGAGADFGYSIAVDNSGNIYVTGYSNATWGSPLHAFGSGNDAFAAKLNASSGVLTWNTFLGGVGFDYGYAIAVNAGNIYLAGESSVTWGSPVRAYGAGITDAFAAKLGSGGALIWNTFLGGSGNDTSNSIAVDGSGNVYVAGYSNSTWGSPVRAFSGGLYDAFATKISAAGVLTWSTFLGGSGADYAYSIAVDGSGNIYVAGAGDATWGSSPIHAHGASSDAYVAKLNTVGALIWNTFLGGSGYDVVYSIAVDGSSGNVYVGGASDATWGSPVRAYSAAKDVFAGKLDSGGILSWNTFLGGSGNDYGNAIFIDDIGAYVTGYSDATWGSPVRPYSAGYDVFTALIAHPATTITQSSIAAQDGWVLESTETSNIGSSMFGTGLALNVGDSAAKQQYRIILSFNTSSLPDAAAITGLTLKIKKNGFIGGTDQVSIFQGFMVDIQTGFFGTFPALQALDFQAAGSKTLGPASPVLTGGFYYLGLINGKSYINKLATNNGLTQIRLRFALDDNNDAVANYLSLYSGEAATATDRPQLLITYTMP